MPSEPPKVDDWDVVDHWTRRIGRWLLVGIPSWLILLAAFNQDVTGIPWGIGLTLATVLAGVVTVIADRRAFAGRRRAGMGPFGRALVAWAAVFFVLALVMGSGGRTGAAVVLVPLIVATVVAAGIELTRRALGRR